MARSKTSFQPGVSGNPNGRPSAPRQQLVELLNETFSIASRKKVLKKLIDDAEAGNHDARTLLLAYTYGKPTEYKELSGPDGGPIQLTPVDYREGLGALRPDDADDADA